MASTVFVDNSSIIYASWLNDVNATIYNGTFISPTITPSNIVCNGSVSGTGFTGLVNNVLSAPGQIGNGTPNTGAFTTLSATTPIAVSSGGTGLATLTANNVMLGNGTSTPSFVAPGTTGNVLTSNGATWQSTASAGGMTLLGTLTTTSGSSQSLTGLNLTSYKQLNIVMQNVSSTNTYGISIGGQFVTGNGIGSGNSVWGIVNIDLTTGVFTSCYQDSTSDRSAFSSSADNYAGFNSITTASTSIVVSVSTGTFDDGSILIYGVR